jgi:iron-sulfur cluster assembly protein/iron-sulfur cluster insertion protein
MDTTATSTYEAVFNITDAAATKLATILGEEEGTDRDADLRLRVAVRPGGCSGFSYEMYFDTETAADDTIFQHPLLVGVLPVVVDASSAPLLRAAVLDYSDGLSGTGFKFTNPNAQRTCGCGQSFS